MKLPNFKLCYQKRLLHNSILLIFVILGFSQIATAQVTVGLDEDPEQYATLQIKDLIKSSTTSGDITAVKGGIMLPRVKLQDKFQLLPFYAGDTTNVDYKASKIKHRGLYVYNLTEDDDKELCLGLNQWDGQQWNCFQTKMGNAKFDPVSCSDITVNGVYVEGTVTNSSNYLTINLNVIKTGAFSITATTTNGYGFYLSGIALSLGKMTINIPCMGTPVEAGTDNLVLNGLDLVSGCTPVVVVSPSIANYSLNCSSIVVNGEYLKGQALTASNTITLNVTVTTAGSYSITTPLTNGVSFSSSGSFTVGTQTVTLIGTGTPTQNFDFPITINSNSLQGNNTCTATIPVTLPAMTYAIIGTGVWSWASTPRLNALTNGGISFGRSGIVRIVSFTSIWQTIDVTAAANNLNNNPVKPDVVLYFAYAAEPNTALTTALSNYINKGGCVIYGSADNTSSAVNTLLSGVFGITTAQAQIAGTSTTDDNNYQIANLPDDPIINGPFGNLSSRYWGEDNASTGSVILTSLPPNSVQICSAFNPFGKPAVNPDYSIVWYNDSKNFVYFGDSTGADTNNTDQDSYPASFSSTGLPQSKFYGNYPHSTVNIPSKYVYNAALELNSIAWALRKAAVSGINPH